MIKQFLLRAIRAYHRSAFIRKPVFKSLFLSDASCRFTPTCSQYCYQAVHKYGTIKGVFLCFKRIIRCHPFSRGGPDPLK